MYEIYKNLMSIAEKAGTVRDAKYREKPEPWQDVVEIAVTSGNDTIRFEVSVTHAAGETGDDS